MKSKRAREIILKSKKDVEEGKIQADIAHIDANHAVRIAEQEAEEHAVKVFEQWCETWLNPLPTHIRETAANSYKQLLIGGQRDE